jgi:hypothetical protein
MTMGSGLIALERAKAARNTAHDVFHTQLAQVQEDLSVRSIGGRVADRAAGTVAQAADVALEHKGVIAGTVAALALWFLRRPIISRIARIWDEQDNETPERNVDDE